MAGLDLIGISRRFGAFTAISNVSLSIQDGEFVTLLGPSGCGKTTLLRTIAGFIAPDEGVLKIAGKPANHIPANRRRTAMCFQSYALFPHMSVRENIRFGLRMQRLPLPEQETRIAAATAMVGLRGLEGRRPAELSGGQQQRVALARAVATHPEVLLFDEPLSNLDAKLREHVRVEIRELQQRLGITSIYVTHDQAEALMISDRIVVMNAGKIEQIGDPETIYRRPRNAFVANFIGVANVVEGRRSEGGFSTEVGTLRLVDGKQPSEDALICWRPEEMVPWREGMPNRMDGTVRQAIFMGNLMDLFIEVNGLPPRAQVTGDATIRSGQPISLSVPPERIHLLERDG
jgi:ABC-type Fe3+/spermidine/putrescine transport system ATPase subunit